jgi:hypothetical protein
VSAQSPPNAHLAWDRDTRAFDDVHEHILHMADALAAGIVKQFPGKFATTLTAAGSEIPRQ